MGVIMKKLLGINILLVMFCGWVHLINASDEERVGAYGRPVWGYRLDLEALDDNSLDGSSSDEEELDSPYLTELPQILVIPSYEEENFLDVSRLGDPRIGELGGGMVVEVEPSPTTLVDSGTTVELQEDEDSDESSSAGSAVLPRPDRLGDWRREADETLSFLDLQEREEGGSDNMLSPQNEFSPESPFAIVDTKTGLLAAASLKQSILHAKKIGFQNQVDHINRLEQMFANHIISLSWFIRELEKIRIEFFE